MKYIEGFLIYLETGKITEHAWLKDENGQIYEPTPPYSEYMTVQRKYVPALIYSYNRLKKQEEDFRIKNGVFEWHYPLSLYGSEKIKEKYNLKKEKVKKECKKYRERAKFEATFIRQAKTNYE